MKHIYTLLGMFSLMSLSTLNAQVLVDEDFSSASGSTPPAGWNNIEIEVGNGNWRFDNPGERIAVSPISEPFAVFDSDNIGSDGLPEEAALETPEFDASVLPGFLYLSFDHQFYDDNIGAEGFVEVWDGSAWVEVMYFGSDTDNPQHEVADITSAVAGAADAKVRFRWTGDWSWWWIVDNVKIEHYNCAAISNLSVIGTTPYTIDLVWDAGSGESLWNIEWGMPGFTPGSGEEEGSASSTDVVYTIEDLTAGTDYVIYVQADCEGSGGQAPWIVINGTTDCAPITTLPWNEGFEGVAEPEYGNYAYPNCWTASLGYWFTDFEGSFNIGVPAYEGTQYAAIFYWDGEDTLWTPEFEMTAGTNYEFKFHYAGDGYEGWDATVVMNDGTTTDALPGENFIQMSDVVSEDYTDHSACFTPTADGTYRFGIAVANNFNPYYLVFDDFSMNVRGTSAGNDGSETVCQTAGLVNLTDIVELEDETGTWHFFPNPSALEGDDLLNPAFIPAGTVEAQYITTGCLVDTVSAMITIVGPSSAGDEGTIAVCVNQPFDLLSGLSGNVDLGGDWYDPSDELLNSSFVSGLGFPGNYNYDYVTGNGVCPDDSATIVVNVTNCTATLEEAAFESVQLYPNPTTGMLSIDADRVFTLSVTDANGRTVMQNTTTVAGTSTIDLSKVDRGIYFVALSNENASKVFRVVVE